MKKLFLVDAYALIFRSYYAFISRPMRNAAGLNTSAIFGFVKFINEIIAKEQPHYIGVAFDPKGGNFRNELYPQYKANRSETPEDIILAVPYIKQILGAMRIPVLEVPGYEADDVIGTIAKKASKADFEVFMVTPDKDFGQLVGDNIYIYKPAKGGEGVEIVGEQQICQNYSIKSPMQVIDILALWGDAADNIPGVMGIGEKGACKLVGEWGEVENILANISSIKGKQAENILATREQLLLSKQLATICTHVPIEFCPDELIMENPDNAQLRPIYEELGFSMFLRAMGSGDEPTTEPKAPVTPERAKECGIYIAPEGQGSLFDAFGAVAEGESDLFASAQYKTAETTPHEYICVTTDEELSAMLAHLSHFDKVCFDLETTGFDIFNDVIVGLSFAVEHHKAYYVPCDNDNRNSRLEALRSLFEDKAISKVGQNIKFDIMFLSTSGITVHGFKYDTMILHYLIDVESRHNMTALAQKYLSYQPIEIESLIGRGARQTTMDRVPLDKITEYAAEDADITLQLFDILWAQVINSELGTLYTQIEEPLIDVLAYMEIQGVKIDKDILGSYAVELTQQLVSIENKIRDIAGDSSLNINSAKQLGEVLFAKLKIDPKPKMTKTKQYSTDEEYLQMLTDRHPIVAMVLEYRGLKKLLSTYVEALPLLINTKTGRLHTSYNQAVTATGRLSSTNPNLQNIPIRDAAGREIRKAFVARDEQHLLLSADYSQVELRLMAHLSGDKALIEAFRKGEDIHSATAALLYHVPIGEVTQDQRRKAKTANFGIIYGISAFGLSQRLTIPRGEAKEIIDGYFASYPGVKEYMERVIAEAHDSGAVKTLFGRRRTLSDIHSSNSNVRSIAERNAINTPIQGSAADIIKLAMIKVKHELDARGLRSKMILQVHDELVIDMLASEQEQVVGVVVSAMESVVDLSVKLIAEYGIGHNWLEAH